jgi:hypothetical protein
VSDSQPIEITIRFSDAAALDALSKRWSLLKLMEHIGVGIIKPPEVDEVVEKEVVGIDSEHPGVRRASGALGEALGMFAPVASKPQRRPVLDLVKAFEAAGSDADVEAIFEAWERGRKKAENHVSLEVAAERLKGLTEDLARAANLKTIPTEAISPLLFWARSKLIRTVENHNTGEMENVVGTPDPLMVAAYDVAAKAAGWKTSSELLADALYQYETDPEEG